MYVRSNALVPEEIPDVIQQGLDAGAKELLQRAALSRVILADNLNRQRLNPKVAAVRQYLADNDVVVKPTDKNLGLAAFPASTY